MRRKKSARISRVKRSVLGQTPQPSPDPPGLRSLTHEKMKSLKSIDDATPLRVSKPDFELDKGESPDPGGHPPGPNLGR